MPNRPALRPLDLRPVSHQGETMWLLHDPLQLSTHQLVFPAALAHLLLFCDGSRTIDEIRRDFSQVVGVEIAETIVADTLAQLDDAYLLENARAAQAQQAMLERYRGQPERPPALAGLSYPDDAIALRQLLAGFAGTGDHGLAAWQGRGVISPHIDYGRGGPVYATTWIRAARAAQEAELVLIFGTDHSGGKPITLTTVPYATPFGRLPIDSALVASLAEAIGPDQAFASELHHRQEHSVELSAVWLHHVIGEMAPPPTVPILVGSFERFLTTGTRPEDDPLLNRFQAALSEATRGRQVLAIASVDLAHVGPHFGDDFVMDGPRRESRRAADKALMAAIAAGDANRFYEAIARVNDRDRVCGFAPIYLLLRYLGETRGTTVAYAQAPADPQDQSLVSICGMLLT